MEKEFKSLSKKLKEIEDELQKDSIRKQKSFLNPVDVLNKLEEDIKEFIKRLKEKLLGYQYQTNPQLNEYCHNNIIKQIDKLAGPELITK